MKLGTEGSLVCECLKIVFALDSTDFLIDYFITGKNFTDVSKTEKYLCYTTLVEIEEPIMTS